MVQRFNNIKRFTVSSLNLPLFLSTLIPIFYLFVCLFVYLFMYLFLAVLGLRCCARAFSSCSEWGLLVVAVRGLLTVVTSLVAEHGL